MPCDPAMADCELCKGARKRAIYRSDFTRGLFQTVAIVDDCECVGGDPGAWAARGWKPTHPSDMVRA